jgi:hypothetical protein
VAKAWSALVLSVALGGAPMQCGTDPDPSMALEETPGEALYQLAEKFKSEGNDKAWRQTLEHLVERYPSSRFAERARQELGTAE